MIRWRLFGITFTIQLSFWFMNALWALMLDHFYPGMRGNIPLLGYIAIWVLCTLACVMAHELGHVIIGRIFGQPGNITLTGLGGQAVGEYGALSRWKRIIVIAAGPTAGFLFVGLVVLFDPSTSQWNNIMDHFEWDSLKIRWCLVDQINPLWRMNGSASYNLVIALLLIISLFMNIFNLFPIIPMDGGMIFKEVCGMVAGVNGERFAYGFSFLLAAGLTLYMLAVVIMKYRILMRLGDTIPHVDLFYPFAFPEISLFAFGSMAFQCLKAYRTLGAMQRHSEYADND